MLEKLENSNDAFDYNTFYFYENGELKGIYIATPDNTGNTHRIVIGISKYRTGISKFLTESEFMRKLNLWMKNNPSLEIYGDIKLPDLWVTKKPQIMKSHKVIKPKTAVRKTVKKPATRKTKRA